MNESYIEFKKQRELGDILSDTFAFLRSQFKPFFNCYFKIVGPFLLAMILTLAVYLYFGGNTLNLIFLDSIGTVDNLPLFIGLALLYLITLVAVYAMSQSTVLHYIKSYANGRGTIDFETIRKEVYGSFWDFIGLGIIVGLSLLAGFIACIIPGVYLYVPLALTFSILVFNGKGVMEAYNYSFTLIKDEWWMTFATFFVIGIIVAVANYAFSLPAQIYQLLKTGIFSGAMDAESVFDIFQDPVYILLNVLSTIGQFLLNLISVVAGVFIYFNLNEKKNFTGTYERIADLGKNTEG